MKIYWDPIEKLLNKAKVKNFFRPAKEEEKKADPSANEQKVTSWNVDYDLALGAALNWLLQAPVKIIKVINA